MSADCMEKIMMFSSGYTRLILGITSRVFPSERIMSRIRWVYFFLINSFIRLLQVDTSWTSLYPRLTCMNIFNPILMMLWSSAINIHGCIMLLYNSFFDCYDLYVNSKLQRCHSTCRVQG